MSTSITLATAFLILIAALVIGVSVPMCFGLSSVWLIFAMNMNPASLLPTGYNNIIGITLLAIPMFIMSGGLMNRGGIGDRLVDWVSIFVGNVRGALWTISIWACAIFGSVCGSSTATLSCIGSIMGPKLEKAHYPREVSAAIMCCAAPLGALIPPSSLMIVFAWSANVSVLACFLSTILPGIILACLLTLVGSIMAKKYPEIENTKADYKPKEFLRHAGISTWRALPALMMPVIILGGIYSGLMTPTESAAVSVVYAAIVAIVIYRAVSLKGIGESFISTGQTTGAIMVMVFFMIILSNLLIKENLPQVLLNFLLSVSDSKVLIMLMINLFLVFLGMIMDNTCGLLLVTPLLLPVVKAIGVSPYTLAAILCVNLGMGSITPPAAPFIYLTSKMFNVNTGKIFKPVMILLLTCYLPVILLTTFVPELSLWLPRLIMGAKFLG